MLVFCSNKTVSPNWFPDSEILYVWYSLLTHSLSEGDKTLKAYKSSWGGGILVWPKLLAGKTSSKGPSIPRIVQTGFQFHEMFSFSLVIEPFLPRSLVKTYFDRVL